MKKKTCPRCKIERDIKEFPILNKTTGRILYCHGCRKEYDKEWWAKVKSKRNKLKNEQAATRRKRNRKYIVDILKKSKCCDCNNDDWRVLEFDHKNRKEKSFNIADASYQSIEKIQNEINKCEIVCANCHNIRTIKQRGYYLDF